MRRFAPLPRTRAVRAVLGAVVGALLLPAPPARADLEFRALQDPAERLDPLNPALGNGLPPNWHLTAPPPVHEAGISRVQVSYDPSRGTVEERYREGSVEVRPPMIVSAPDYYEVLSDRSYQRVWHERTRTTRSVNKDGLRRGGLFRFDIPVQLPKAVRSIVGDGAPNIEVSGSERIAIVGTSDWTVRNDIYSNLTGERRRQGAFPSFEMKQELNVNLTGSIGDKIKVDVDQSSNVNTSIDNRVKLRYDGDDDDMIQTIELGNTNLSLQGASLRQEGLFGVKTVMKLGNFDFTTIASKQDAKTETARFTPSGENRIVRVTDLEYIRRRYFFIADHPLPTRNLNLRLFVSSADVQKDPPGVARLDPLADSSLTNPQQRSNWRELTLATDYDVIYPYTLTNAPNNEQIPVIRLRFAVAEGQLLAATYRDEQSNGTILDVGTTADPNNLLLKVLKARAGDYTTLPSGLIDPANPWFPALDYELKNFYDLQGRDIDRTSLSIKIRRKDSGAATDPDAVLGVPLVTVLGLDQRSKEGSLDPFVPDGLVDDQFVDVTEGTLFFPDLHPFAPDPACGFLCLDDFERNLLAQADTLANPIVYYKQNPEIFKDDRYYIEAQFRSSQQGFYLGRFGILENSEQVKVDGIPQRRDVDYRIDYTTGQLTFVNPPSPEAVITADFSYPPGFGQVQRTLLGVSGAYNPASNLSFSTSLLHESRGAQEQNPKLGEEPARSTLGDFGTVLSFRPVWMTRLADQVPGITTDQPSALNIQGNLSMSLPNPNTKGEAYIDDMEGNRESNTVGLARLQWFFSSVPVNRFNPRNGSTTLVSSAVEDHARLQWYNPRPDSRTAAKEHDLKPVLTDEEGGDNNHQVLEWNIQAPTGVDTLFSEDWTGITQSISTTGTDFSRIRFVEIWVNDFDADHDSTKALLHLSIGRVSEDAFWSKTASPNGLLDTEDKNKDGVLDGGDPRSPNFEDTGFDGVVSELEPGYDPTTNPDPSGDDYRYNVQTNPDDYSTINNLEFNGIGEANARPDTEDLNRDTFLDTGNNYFETTIDLADTQYVAIDVPREPEYLSDPEARANIKANNGWRLFRIPVTGETFRSVGSPSWQNVQHVRLWVSDVERPMLLQIGGIEFVGSRWLEAAITNPDMIARDVQLDIRTRNNKDDAEYEPPYEVQNQVGGQADRREQSLALGYTRLAEGDTLLAFKTLGATGTGLGWAQYRQIKFYVHGEADVEAKNLRAIARFGPDTLNYYEYSVPVRTGWQSVLLPLEALSRLKEQRPRTERVWIDSTTAAASGEVYTVVGNPSFTRISRLSFGLTVRGAPLGGSATGEVWINELRLADVRKEAGTSGNVSVQASFADLVAMNLSVQKQDENFFRVGQGGNQGTGLNHTAVGFSTTLQVDRFMPTSGVQLPIRYSMQHSSDVPKFRTGSDVSLDAARQDIETRRLDRQTIDISYRRSSSIRRGLSKYTLDALSGTMAYSRSSSVNPESRDSSWAFTASGSYDLPIGGGGFSIAKNKINLLPEVVGFSAGWSSSRAVNYSRTIFNEGDSTAIRSDAKIRLLTLGTTTSWVPLPSFRVQYALTSQRDMLQRQEGGLGFNKGTEIDHLQTVQVNWTPRWLALFAPNVNFRARYHEDSRPERRITQTDPRALKNIDNQGSATVRFSLPLSRLGVRTLTRRRTPADSAGGGFSPLAPVRFALGKFQDIQTNFNFDRTATMSRVTGDPGFAFKTGFSQATDPGLNRVSGSVFGTSRRYTTNLSTAFRPANTLTVDIRADHGLSFLDQTFGARRTERFQWPDLKGRWADLHRALSLGGVLKSLTLQSGFSRLTEKEGPSDGAIERRTNTRTFGPLLGWDVVFQNDIRASLTSSITKTTTEDFRTAGLTRNRQATNTDLRLNKTFPAAKGIKLPFKKERIRLPNDLNLNLTVGLQSDYTTSIRSGERPYIEINQERLNVSSGSTYNFSRTISGGFNFGYRQTNDKKAGLKQRGISVEFNAQFAF